MEASDAASYSPSQSRVPDSRLPGADPPVAAGADEAEREKAASPPALVTEQECEDYDVSTLALWPVFVMIFMGVGVMVTTLWYGPNKVLHAMLQYLVPARPTFWHMYAIYFAIVACITLAIPVLLLLLPVPTIMFGFWKGFLVTFMSLMTAATLSFIIGRYVARRPVRRFLEGRGCKRSMRLLSVLEDDEAQSMQLLVLYRFLTIPMSLRNYGPSVLRVHMMKLVVSAIPHSLWSATVFATAGSALKGPAELLRDGHKITWRTPQWQQILGLAVAFVSLTLFSWIAWRAYSHKVDEEEKRQEISASSSLKGSEEGGRSVHYGTNDKGVAVEIRTSEF